MPRIDDGRIRTDDVEVDCGDGEVVGAEAAGEAPSSFAALLLRAEIVQGLEKEGYLRPSPIQARAIPIGRIGSDLITQAKSGTGKTCMFTVIVLDSIKLDFRTPQALIVSPTRELAHQTRDVVRSIGSFMPGLGCEAFVGGISTKDDVELLTGPSACVHVVAGTPGRLRTLIEAGALAVEGLRQLVLDEADVLLADQFRPQLDVLFAALPLRKQVVAVSATYTAELLALVRGYMRDPQEVLLIRETASLKGVNQFHIPVRGDGSGGALDRRVLMNARLQALVGVLDTTSFHQCVVFTNSRGVGQRAATLLDKLGFTSQFVCGDHPQKERLAAVAALRGLKLRVLVSSDLTSRGIDIDTINLVVNLEMPPSHETYLHRVGRTGRFGTLGVAVTIVGPDEVAPLFAMAKALNVEIPEKPEVIPAEMYQFEIKQGTDEGQNLEALLGARRQAEESGPKVEEVMRELTFAGDDRSQSAGARAAPTRATRGGMGVGKNAPPGEGARRSEADAGGSGAIRRGGADFDGGEGVLGGRGAGGGRHLGCLGRGASVDVAVERQGRQVLQRGWIHSPGPSPGQFWVTFHGGGGGRGKMGDAGEGGGGRERSGDSFTELADVRSIYRQSAPPPPPAYEARYPQNTNHGGGYDHHGMGGGRGGGGGGPDHDFYGGGGHHFYEYPHRGVPHQAPLHPPLPGYAPPPHRQHPPHQHWNRPPPPFPGPPPNHHSMPIPPPHHHRGQHYGGWGHAPPPH